MKGERFLTRIHRTTSCLRRAGIAGVLIASVTMHVYAWSKPLLLMNQDEKAMYYMNHQQYQAACETFTRTDWRGIAAYRAGHYQEAVEAFASLQTADGFYNQGNAFANMQAFDKAIQAYARALQRNPHHQDALFNKKLLEKLMRQQQAHKKSKDTAKQQAAQKPVQKKTATRPSNSPVPSSKNKKAAQRNQQQASSTSTTRAAERQKVRKQIETYGLNQIPDPPFSLLKAQFLQAHRQRIQGGTK